MKSVALARAIRAELAPSRSFRADPFPSRSPSSRSLSVPLPFEQIPRRPDSRRASRFDMIVGFFPHTAFSPLFEAETEAEGKGGEAVQAGCQYG